ncbi:hypothetical protein FF100_32600 [Methylobacterium terricola]|uniref:Uncharacterized protein n=1 Tax=Methylobacterium terricola TaxID=2583531 RepID=A0A5C4L8H6_9HYPH|nr:hypothetical protein [Methylobacterium terricola]TNC07339.1 hypothetical protein FF100_32600 [Methylobacterium terricola]
MTGGEAYKQKLITDDALDAAIAAYLADPSKPVVLVIGDKRLDVAAAVLAHQWSADELAVGDATPARRRNAGKTAVLVAPVWFGCL